MKFFEDSNALDSLRHSDFDSLSAYGEVIDNSLQAEAKTIKMEMFNLTPRNNYAQIEYLAFADDGIGMPVETLHACLKLGWSSRFNDRTGIGRFGVGMVLGAIHEAKRIEVYSKQVSGEWHYTYVDLDEVSAGRLDSIPMPSQKKIPEKFAHLVSESHGTLVLWSKYDKQKKSADLIAADAMHWIGRTFRYFIWEGVDLWLNSELVPAHDPLYVRTEKTKFPADPKGTLHKTIPLAWHIPRSSGNTNERSDSLIEIRMSTLPREFWPSQGSGGSSSNTERRVMDNEGISILRNKREVFYGTLPYWSSVKFDSNRARTWSFDEKDRWWGCEILFNAELDSEFSVRNIKRGADPQTELKISIKKLITPTRKSVLEEIDRVWKAHSDETKRAKSALQGEGGGVSLHGEAEKVALATKQPPSHFNSSQSAEDAAAELGKKALHDKDESQRNQMLALFKAQPFTINESRWSGKTFWEVYHAGGNALLSYNRNHPFFKQYYGLLEELEAGTGDPTETAQRLKILIDLLLMSAAKSQALNDDCAAIDRAGDFVDDLNDQWGYMLANYVASWEKNSNGEYGD
jgi:hypothetical protein